MPMTFPTFESLKQRATQRNFRQPLEDESESQYRTAFADFMQNVDMVEAGEIRLGTLLMDFVREADPLSALSAIMGKSREETNAYMADILGSEPPSLEERRIRQTRKSLNFTEAYGVKLK